MNESSSIHWFDEHGHALPDRVGAVSCEIVESVDGVEVRRTYAHLTGADSSASPSALTIDEDDWIKGTWDIFDNEMRLVTTLPQLFVVFGLHQLDPAHQAEALCHLMSLASWRAAPPTLKAEAISWLGTRSSADGLDSSLVAIEGTDTMTPESGSVGGVADTQRVELLGRNIPVSSLLRAEVEVARPERDRGIDLLAYLDRDLLSGRFAAVPIQMKASQGRTFSLSEKYSRFPGLIMAFVWDVNEAERTEIYALSYNEAHQVAQDSGWLDTASWTDGKHYVTNKPSTAIVERLAPFRATPERWVHLLQGAFAPPTLEPAGGAIPGARTVHGTVDVGQVFRLDDQEYVVVSTFIDGGHAVPIRREA